jgi:uncharacterized protein YjiS (DUF1127 family)
MLDPTVSIKYMLAGYAVALVIIPAYLVSLYTRWRTQKRNLRDLEEMKEKK